MSGKLLSVVVLGAVGVMNEGLALRLVHSHSVDVGGRVKTDVSAADQVWEVGLHKCDTFRFTTLLAIFLLFDDELFLAFGGFEQGAATWHVSELGIRHLFQWLRVRGVQTVMVWGDLVIAALLRLFAAKRTAVIAIVLAGGRHERLSVLLLVNQKLACV